MTQTKEDLTGRQQFRIKVIKKVPRPTHLTMRGTYWEYECNCGKSNIAHRTTIIRGLKSCGCLGKEKHYKTKSKEHYRYLYNVWRALQYRCYRPHNKSYKDYGGRGIKMSDEWKDFGVFYNDMINGYKRGLTLERINVDGVSIQLTYKRSRFMKISN